jgi:hypothetical protein
MFVMFPRIRGLAMANIVLTMAQMTTREIETWWGFR